jgi:hypothetical protein
MPPMLWNIQPQSAETARKVNVTQGIIVLGASGVL